MDRVENCANQDFPKWNPQMSTRAKIGHSSIRVRYKALRNSSSAFVKRQDVRLAVLKKYGYKCAICGAIDNLQIDHIVSVYRCAQDELPVEDLNKLENLQLLCAECNARKAP